MSYQSRMSPGRVLVLGFAAVIFTGALLLMLPISANPGMHVHPVDALFTSTSAVCVTGLVTVDMGGTFSVFGRAVVAALIQVGGLGFTSFGVLFILLAGKNIGLRERILVKEAMNLNSLNGIVKLVKSVLKLTLAIEGIGMLLSFLVFLKKYSPLDALGFGIFHSISAFNNAGFDVFGGFDNLLPYQSNVLLNLTTCGLIILGGLGFTVIKEVLHKRRWRTLSMNSKIVLVMTGSLLLAGTLLLKGTEEVTWLGAFFQSTAARTAGFSTYNLGKFTNAGLFILIILMFIGASPGSTGGGIKTTTFFTMLKSIFSIATNRDCTAFKRRIPNESVVRAFTLTILALSVVCLNTLLLCVFEPQYSLVQVLFEVVSAFGTVGLSTGITPHLTDISKIILSCTMFFGRLGPLTIACVWSYHPPSNLLYAEERITIG
ncbi:trk system potassium uptake protein TrkH [Hydrogenoanaerobacterium saccharovorans]|uniref:Trk system potassium uptake protein TrkH n=1 Tax=Hydrogenoanaerobacterium saccharovorans TaxID=474960 RepID=A0A1H8B5C5_9FIRM|nr:trk system potassium uptake protein TrkH [Hydrogenoanaerobacterium saccharovorans]SEM77344.1 trk system potassium uptake protein TrkH [Hydrogenoanaerobacterium saccharovorans]